MTNVRCGRRLALALWLAVAAGPALGNGCIVVRPTSQLTLGLDDAHAPRAGQWEYTLGYRWFLSDRHFRGRHEERERQAQETDVRNRVHVIDQTLTRWMDERWRVSVSLPVQFANRSSLYEHDRVNRHEMEADGIGDLRIMAYRDVLAPREDRARGITLGIGVKLPTGEDDVTDTAFRPDGPVEREVDQSIQPGDGGTGLILELQAYTQVFDERSFAFFTGSYLINPRETNGVPTHRSRANEAVMSVPDTYQLRTGFTRILNERGSMSGDLALRMEGVPAEDLIGGSDGFRRPGYAIYIEPGINLQTHGGHRFGFSLPIAIERNRVRSVADRENGIHGDAAFADYLVLATYGYRW